MVECVIVAIPDERDQVHRLSSEKIAHMTLLYLGELPPEADTTAIAEYVGHVTSLTPTFGAEVTHRGVLGKDEADVLFLNRDWLSSAVNFRSSLLANDQISTAYHAAYQHPEWTPHVTLGYPDSPANKPAADEEPFPYFVSFDRIAVWFGDFEGPEFKLSRELTPAPLAHNDHLDDFLAHYGVKGMKWGVRRDLKKIRGASNRTEYLQKKDAAWIDKVNANPKLEKISRMVAKDAKSAIKELNRAYPKKFGMRSKADQARYDRALEETLAASIDRAAYKTHKLSPTRAHEVKITRTDSGELLAKVTRRTNPKIIKTEAKLNRMDERAKKAVAHAEEELTVDDFEGLGFLLVEDEDRMVVDILTPFDDVSHAEQLDDFLAHYGVKGMKWGVIRKELGKLKTENERHDYLQKLESDRMAKFEDPKFRREILDEAAPGIAKAMVGLEKRYPKENKFWASMGAGAGKHKAKGESWEEYFRSNPKALSDADEAYGRFSFLAQAAKIHTDEYAKVIERKIGKVSETGVYETIPVITSGDPDLRVTFVTRYNTEPRMRKQLTEAIRHAKNKSIVIAEDVYLITSEGLELTHSNNDLSDFLAHYGVKGMRWGVRKDRSSSSGGRQQKKSTGDKEDDNAKSKATKSKNELSRYSDDKLTSMTAELKGLDALSDAELKKLTGRMQLEQTYRDLQAKQPKTKSKAEKFLDGAKLLGTTANQLNEFLNTPAGKALQSKLKSKVKK